MGVVYKLKYEVIEFIIREKRDNPRISCRKLSELIQEKFQIKVSKSSVNEVIKKANLSSPIGRRAKSDKKPKKFTIPEEKKDQLLVQNQEFLIDHKKDEVHLPEVKHEYQLDEPGAKDSIEIEEKDKEKAEKPVDLPKEEPSEPILLPEEPQEELSEPILLPEEPPEVEKKTEEMSKQGIPTGPVIQEAAEEEKPEELEEKLEEKAEVPEDEELLVDPFAKDEQEIAQIGEAKKDEQGEPPEERKPEEIETPPEPAIPEEETVAPEQKPEEEVISEIPSDQPKEKELVEEKAQEAVVPKEEPEQQEETKEEKEQDVVPKEVSPPTASQQETLGEEPLEQEVEAKKDEQVEKTLSTEKEPQETIAQEQEQKTPEPVKEEAAPQEREQEIPEPKKEDIAQQKEPVEETIVQEEVETKAEIPKGELYDGMGCFFLKAAEWALSNSSILGGLLSRYTSVLASEVSIASEALLYLEAFGIDQIEGLKDYDKKGLWKLNGLEQGLNQELLLKIAEDVKKAKGLSVAMSNEYSQIFSEISYIKITLADEKVFCLDAQFKTIWGEKNVHSAFTCTLNKALSALSNNIISNVQPVIIANIPGFKNFSTCFYDLLWSFENLSEKKITKIGIFDSNNDEIANFSSIPSKRRSFIIGAWPWQEEVKKFIGQDQRSVSSLCVESIDKQIFFSELKAEFDQPLIGQKTKIRVALLRESGLSWPMMCIMTNISSQEMAIEDVIRAYLLRWPNQKEGHDDFSTKSSKATYGAVSIIPSHNRISLLKGDGQYNLLEGTADLRTNIEFLLSGLNNFCQRHFYASNYEQLDFSTIQERFYRLPGHVYKKDGRIVVSLVVPVDYAYKNDLAYAIRRLNESDIKDYSGSRLIMRIVS